MAAAMMSSSPFPCSKRLHELNNTFHSHANMLITLLLAWKSKFDSLAGFPAKICLSQENEHGDSYPVGIFVPDWAASWAANVLVATIVEESLYY